MLSCIFFHNNEMMLRNKQGQVGEKSCALK